jgi:hypothetical protein
MIQELKFWFIFNEKLGCNNIVMFSRSFYYLKSNYS